MPRKKTNSKSSSKKKNEPIVIHLVHPTAIPKVHSSLANQYMNVPFESPQVGNALAERLV
jgi:hypothetical protein